jgi:hypothetical protein
MFSRRILAACVSASLALVAVSVDAKPRGLRAVRVQDGVEIDGVPNEWDGDWRALTFKASGQSPSDADCSARVLVAYDRNNLYLAADVRDDKLVAGGDFIELLLGIPGGTLHSIRLFPGSPGKSRAAAKTGGGATIDGARIVEAPTQGGWTLEAAIPWRGIPKSDTVRVGYRGALLVHDADASPREETVMSSADSSAYASLPPLSTEPELGLGNGLLRDHNLTSAPRYNLLADVIGDRLQERVLVYDRYLVVLGPGYRKGEEYFYRDLGTSDLGLEIDDLTGDGKADMLVRKRINGAEQAELLSYHAGGDVPQPLFQQTLSSGEKLRIAGRGKGATLVVEAAASSRTFGFKGSQFELTASKDKVDTSSHIATTPVPAAPPPPPPARVADTPSTKVITRKDPNAPDPDAVYALYKQKRNVTSAARFELQADFAEDERSERLVVHGADLVVFGAGFRGGRSFAATTLSVDAGDIDSVTTRDVTGDGKSDIVVRAKMRAPLPAEVGQGEMIRTVTLVFQLRDGQIERVFAAEIARRIGDKQIEANVTLGTGSIELTPGRATGYDEKTYPWKQKEAPDGGFEPLLLPWGGIDRVRLKFDGKSFVRA